MAYKVAGVHENNFSISTPFSAQRKRDTVRVVVDNLVNPTSFGVLNHPAECLV
jgi:hypothetical protein